MERRLSGGEGGVLVYATKDFGYLPPFRRDFLWRYATRISLTELILRGHGEGGGGLIIL